MKQEKKRLRQLLIQQREALDSTVQMQHAERVAQWVNQTAAFQQASHLAFYLPVKGELSPLPLLNLALEAQKYCYLPQLTLDNRLRFFKVMQDSTLVENQYGILEPISSPQTEIKADNLDLVFLPLVGFDPKCQRLGMGGAYYDRTFSFRKIKHKPFLIGLAHDCQGVPAVPQNDFDVKLDMVVTEIKIYTKE